MAAKKRSKNSTPNYSFSLNKDSFDKDNNYLGKLRSNFFGTEFVLYDAGKNPKDTDNSRDWRSELSSIEYETNLFGFKGPRKLKVNLAGLTNTEIIREVKPGKKGDGIVELAKKKDKEIITFANKLAKWSESKYHVSYHIRASILCPRIRWSSREGLC